MSSAAKLTPEELAEEVSRYYADPLGFVMLAYPWGQPGALEKETGPDTWQAEELERIGAEVRKRKFDGSNPVKPIRLAVSSGHGVGKGTMAAWLVNWIMSTRPNSKGTITANTYTQLDTKTWATIRVWTKRCITAHWFTVTKDRMYRKGQPENWFCSPQSSKEENAEAFAGQHERTSTSFYIFDEASAIPRKITETAEGGLTDGEPMIFMFGNPTQSDGPFYDAVFGVNRDIWLRRIVDSQTCRFPNKKQIAEWATKYGVDSDFFKVRVLGQYPNASTSQFIDLVRIREAQQRAVIVDDNEPLIAGVDLAWGGDDDNVIRFRRGKDARSIPPITIPGEQTKSADLLAHRLGEILGNSYRVPGRNGEPMLVKIKQMFVDSAGIAGSAVPKLIDLGFRNISEINFGAHSPNLKYENMRAYIWGQAKDFLLLGSIDSDPKLENDLAAPGYSLTKHVKILLEPKPDIKKRIGRSPDNGDALALTFARPVAVDEPVQNERRYYDIIGGDGSGIGGEWMR